MKVKSLLALAMLAGTLTASAAYPIYFRDTVAGSADGGGNFTFTCKEGSEAELKVSNGIPKFAEDGSITLTNWETPAGGGRYFRTKKLTEECPKEYTVLAMDYKTTLPLNDLVVFYHEFTNELNMFNGALFTVAEDYQTAYVVLDRNVQPKWGDAENFQKSYFWISWNDNNAREKDFAFTVKNIRLLTLDEATEECKSSTATSLPDAISFVNTSFSIDMDPDMGTNIYAWAEGTDYNSVLRTGNLTLALPAGVTTFAVDYKMTGTDCTPAVWIQPAALNVGKLPMEALGEDEDPYEAEWKTATIDLKDVIAQHNFAQTFGSNHYLWLQFRPDNGFSKENVMWLRNARWINPDAQSGVAELGVAERPADNRVFNLMGVEVKGELTPGLYIRNGKKFIVK